MVILSSCFPSSNAIDHNLWLATSLEFDLSQHKKCNMQLVLQM